MQDLETRFHCRPSDPSFAVLRWLLLGLESSDLAELAPRVARLARLEPPGGVSLLPSSLTDGVGPSGQIRFNLHRRTRRGLVEAVEALLRRSGGRLDLTVCNSEHIDPGSAYFLDVLLQHTNDATVQRIECVDTECTGTISDRPLQDQLAVRERVELAWELLSAGDPWGCTRLLESDLPIESGDPRAHQALATAAVALDRPFDAERHFLAWIAAGDPLDVARAKYGLAMLLARFHVPERRDPEGAARYLDSALEDLKAARDQEPELDTTFEEVFNRNGYALLEFRAGQPAEALTLLRDGLSRLPDSSPRNHLHRSVLLYNMAQVHRRIGQHEEALVHYQALLALDPHMPEYRCEYALSLLAAGRTEEAADEVDRALELDPYVPESHALRGYVSMKAREYRDATVHYRRAWQLKPDLQNAYAYAYVAAEGGEHTEALRVLTETKTMGIPDEHVSNFSSLAADVLVELGRRDDAVAELRSALDRCPQDQRLLGNLRRALQAAVSPDVVESRDAFS